MMTQSTVAQWREVIDKIRTVKDNAALRDDLIAFLHDPALDVLVQSTPTPIDNIVLSILRILLRKS